MERYQNMDHGRNSNSRNMNMEKIGFKKFIFSLDDIPLQTRDKTYT